MAYSYTNGKGNTYYLHMRETTLKSGNKQTIYFFAKDVREGSLDSIPEGFEVFESRNGLPVLKRLHGNITTFPPPPKPQK